MWLTPALCRTLHSVLFPLRQWMLHLWLRLRCLLLPRQPGNQQSLLLINLRQTLLLLPARTLLCHGHLPCRRPMRFCFCARVRCPTWQSRLLLLASVFRASIGSRPAAVLLLKCASVLIVSLRCAGTRPVAFLLTGSCLSEKNG